METNMNIEELKIKLSDLGVPSQYYSINGSNVANTYILQQVYTYWECYYIDERGGQNDYHRFDNESEACIYFYKILENEMKY